MVSARLQRTLFGGHVYSSMVNSSWDPAPESHWQGARMQRGCTAVVAGRSAATAVGRTGSRTHRVMPDRPENKRAECALGTDGILQD